MPKEIIISVSGEQSRIAIVENEELVELYVENPENVRTIGDIYLARVRRILPGIKAAFVDIGQPQDAFLHFSDLSDDVPALLELAEGRVVDRGSASLAKEPPDQQDLEAETAEEQLAAKRLREVKRQPSGEKRGGRRPSPAEQADTDTARSDSSGRRSGRSSRKSQTTEKAQAEDVPVAPAVLPPDAAVEQAVALPDEGSEQPREPETAAQGDQPANRAKPKRRRGRRRAPGDEAGSAVAPDEGTPTEPRRRGSRRGQTKAGAGPEAPETGGGRAERSEPAIVVTDKPVVVPSRAESGDDAKQPVAPPVLKSSSRYRIDLTGGSDTPPRRREEEEEEEEETKVKSGRRRGRSGRGGRGNGNQNRRGNAPQDDEGATTSKSSNGRPPERYLKENQRILVKIIKEPMGSKGSRVSTDVSLAGRFLVLVPAADYVAVSKKIESAKERRRLRALARSLLPEGLGVIVRTVAEGRDAKTLDMDLRLLVEKWRKIEDQLRKRPEPPVKLYEDVSMVSSIIRDLFSEDYDQIVIDDPKVYRSIRSYVQAVAPQMADAVKLHQRKEPIFRTFKIERDIRAAFETRVPLPGGGYLFVETTEAMHVIDVNSGRAGKGLSQEENALRVNLEAAREIAKQLRLRDLGGIIVVDFIDMRSDSYRRKVLDELRKQFRKDRAVTKMLPISDFGVMEITRQRLRPSITTTLDVEDLGEVPPDEPQESDEPTRASSRSASEVVGHLEHWLNAYRENVQERHRKRPILIRVHPFLAAYLQRGIPSLLTRWRFKMRLKLKLDVDETAAPLSFSVRDEKSGKNLTRRYDPDTRPA